MSYWIAGPRRSSSVARAVLFSLWLLVVLFLASRHVVWRDEVRALSLALEGSDTVEMLQGLHGEGHPALWYLLLRAAHMVVPSPAVLLAVAIAIGVSATALLVFTSTFRWPTVVLIVFGHACLYEYAVMARNYGISMLLLFTIAAVYARYRDGLVIGGLLALLANCNVHSILLVAAFLLFQAIEILGRPGLSWRQRLRLFLPGATVAMAGVVVCVITVYPPFNDAAVSRHALNLPDIVTALLFPARSFAGLFPPFVRDLPPLLWVPLGSLMMFGSTLALVRSPGALMGSLAALVLLSFFFEIVYAGGYRHQALWLVFLVTLVWITGATNDSAYPPWMETVARVAQPVGAMLFTLLLALQIPGSVSLALSAVQNVPESRSKDLAAFVTSHPEYRQSWIVADPDYLFEPLPYYLPNPTYLMREHRPGAIVTFSTRSRLDLSLDDILTTAQGLRVESQHPVLIVLATRLDPSAGQVVAEGYDWTLTTTPDQVARFLSAVRRLQRFAPARSDESFDLYTVD